MPEDELKVEDMSGKFSLIERMDYGRRIPEIPAMPHFLRWVTLLFRIAPGYIEAFLGLIIITNPDVSHSPVIDWTAQQYGFTQNIWALSLSIFGLFAVIWSITGRWRYGFPLRVAGMIVFTFPLLFYIVSTAWYVTVVDKTLVRTAAFLYISLYLLLISGHVISAGLAIWFEQIRAALEKGKNA